MILAIQNSYGSTRSWCGPFHKVVVTVFGCHEVEDARNAAETIARILGWTPARWWQVWRWGENDRCRNLERHQSDKTRFQGTGSMAYAISFEDRTGPVTRMDMSCPSLEAALTDALKFIQLREAAATATPHPRSLAIEQA